MRRRRLSQATALVAIIGAAACATVGQRAARDRATAADALFARGCYLCLIQAFEHYRALAQSGYEPAVMTRRAFDTAVLLAAREKDLAMEATGWIATARELAPSEPRSTVLFEMADALPWAAGRHDSDFEHTALAAAGPPLDALDRWGAALGPAASRDLPSTYLVAAALCAFTPTRLTVSLTPEALAPAHAASPLMQYVVGSCRRENASHLASLANDPDFHEAGYHLARFTLFQPGNAVRLEARTMLEAVREAMPSLVANTYLLAGLLDSMQEYDACAAMYAELMAIGGAPRASRLNRAVCLTNGEEREDAIATATELIETPGVLRGEAFYWRALNRYYLKDLPSSRADVDAAKPLYDDAVVYALSGFIAYEMEQKEYAHSEFGEAWHRSGGYCTAALYQGRIDAEFERWEPAASEYTSATACYETEVRRAEFNIAQIQKLDASDPTREQRLKEQAAILDGARLQLAHAAYNVAYSNGRLGRAEAAIPFAEKAAAAHEDMHTLATELLTVLRKGG